MVASSAWPRRRKHSKMFSLCTTQITHTVLLGCIWILTFISTLYSCFAGVIWFPLDVIMAKEKYGLDDGWTPLIFSTDDGCTRWWRWLHRIRRVIFDTHSPLQINMHIGCMIVVKCDTCKIFGALAHLDCVTTSIAGNGGNRHSMQVTHSQKERMFRLFHPQLKINLWIIRGHKLKLLFSVKWS